MGGGLPLTILMLTPSLFWVIIKHILWLCEDSIDVWRIILVKISHVLNKRGHGPLGWPRDYLSQVNLELAHFIKFECLHILAIPNPTHVRTKWSLCLSLLLPLLRAIQNRCTTT
jgi:hypothetical protein